LGKKKQTVFEAAGVPVQPIHWRDWQPDFLLIAGLLETRSALETIQLLKELANKLTSLGSKSAFYGLVSELPVALADLPDLAPVRAELSALFSGANRCLLAMFPFPDGERLRSLLTIGTGAEGFAQLLAVVDRTSHGRFGRSTRSKMVRLLMQRGLDPKLSHMDSDAFNRALLATDEEIEGSEAGSAFRASWNGLAVVQQRTSWDWPAAFWVYGAMNTPAYLPMRSLQVDRLLQRSMRSLLRGSMLFGGRLWKASLGSRHL
jgi:hypothetical protein